LARSLGNPAGSVLLARGRADVAFYWNIVTITLILPVFITAAAYGVTAIAAAWTAVMAILLPTQLLMLQRFAAIKAIEVIRAVAAPIGLAVAAGTIGLGITRGVSLIATLPAWVSLSTAVVSTLLTYVACALWLMPDVAARIRDILGRRSKRRSPCPG